MIGTESPWRVETENPFELLETESPLELVKTKILLDLIGIESPLSRGTSGVRRGGGPVICSSSYVRAMRGTSGVAEGANLRSQIVNPLGSPKVKVVSSTSGVMTSMDGKTFKASMAMRHGRPLEDEGWVHEPPFKPAQPPREKTPITTVKRHPVEKALAALVEKRPNKGGSEPPTRSKSRWVEGRRKEPPPEARVGGLPPRRIRLEGRSQPRKPLRASVGPW
ncbi:hypothetical protein B296_00013386 [Ensete ventricosum]|uniref:Uncharacterized protein n=1 Tax=Ensete ventricosum TaxID=4639 RepID=A0A426ZST9_ENSVE|nr:hypothetical protein B296_00013386 [Ensete ventricosum]